MRRSPRKTLQPRKSFPGLRRGMLHLEFLEDRVHPAGGLAASIVDTPTEKYALINPASAEPIRIFAQNDSASQQLFNFFRAADGQAVPTTIEGGVEFGGQVITGAFTFAELADRPGVGVTASNAAVTFGNSVGVQLSDAGGALALVPSGLAARLTTDNVSDGVGLSIVGLPGLGLSSSAFSYEVNTTGANVDIPVSTPLGTENLTFADGTDRLEGDATFTVGGPSPAFSVGGDFIVTRGGDSLLIGGEGVDLTLYAGSVQAVALSSETADFTLGLNEDAEPTFALVDDSFTVSGFTLLPGRGLPAVSSGDGQLTFSASLGPIALEEVGVTVPSLSFGAGGLSVAVGLSAASASLSFAKEGTEGDSSGLMSAVAEDLAGSFTLEGDVDPATGRITSFGASGAFAFTAASFELDVPGVLTASANDLAINYDPQAGDSQELLVAQDLTLSVPKLKLLGELTGSEALPGLVVRTDGFAFGAARLTVEDTFTLGVLEVTNPYVELGNFRFSTSEGVTLDRFQIGAGGIAVAAAGMTLTGEDVAAELGFDAAGAVNRFTFSAGSLTGHLGSLVTLNASDVEFNPTATGSDPLLSIGTASATVSIAAADLSLTGAVGGVVISGAGAITGPQTLSVSADFGADTAAKLKLPPFLPFKLDTLSLDWSDFDDHPDWFTIAVSASVNGTIGPLTFSGGVDRLVIDPFRLANDQFPIVALDGFSVGVAGDLFAGHIEGAVVGGIVKLDDEGNVLDDDETDFASTVFYAGIDGGFQFGDIGVQILIGFSERGFLQGYLRADAPVVLEPISGLTLSGFRGGISFNATPLPVPQSPDDLLNPIFQPTTSLTADQWQEQLKQQVVNQVSGGSRIFIIEDGVSAIIDELQSGEVASGGALAAAFDDAGYSVADDKVSGEVTELEAGTLWQVKYLAATYLIALRGGKLDLTSARFTTEDEALASSLGEGGVVTQDVLGAFAAHELMLHAGAVVEVIARDGSTPTKWQITDGGTVYFVTARGDRLAVTGGDSAAADADAVVRIEAGATLYSSYVSQHTFRADVDIIITTDGKFVILGKATLADNVSTELRLFADLSQVDKANPTDPVKLVFLGTFPATEGGPSLVTVKGQATIEFLDAAGNLTNPAVTGVAPAAFRFNVLGRGEVGVSSFATAVFGGDAGPHGGFADLDLQIANSPTVTSVELNVSGSLSIEGIIPASNLVSAAGRMIITREAGGPVEIVGAVKLDFTTDNPDLSFLADAGISANASLLLGFNTSTASRDLELKLPGREPETLTLDPATLVLEGEGSLSFGQSAFGVGAQIGFDGAFSARIAVDAPLLVLPGSAAGQLSRGTIPQAIVDALGLDGTATVSALVVPGAGPRWRIDDGTKTYYVVTRGGELAVVDNTRAATDLTVRGDLGVDLDLFVAGRLDVSVSAGDELKLLSLDAVGVLAVRDLVGMVNGSLIAPQVVGRVDLLVSAGLQGVAQVEGSAQLLINTLGQEYTYAIPDRLQDRLQAIQDKRGDATGLSLPTLPVANGQLAVVVPGHATQLDGTPLPDSPYFVLQFGDPDETTPPGGSADPDGDGLVDVSLTIADSFRLEGDFRILVVAGAFELDVSANASLALPGAENLLNAEATGRLHINSDGLVGYIGLQADLNLPQVDLRSGVEVYLGVNTTSTASTIEFQNPNLQDQPLPAHSGVLYVGGLVDIAGFGLEGSFSLLVGAEALELEIHAGLEFFGSSALRVDGTAEIYYGANPGLVLDAALTVGGSSSSGDPVPFGVQGVFEASGQLSLSIDTRIGFGEIAVKDLELKLLSVITFTGDASITGNFGASGEQYLRVSGSFAADLFGLAKVSASGYFDTRGFFDLDLDGRVVLGTDDWGISADVDLFASYLPNQIGVATLNFGGSASGEVRAAGVTLVGAGVGIDYNGESGKATAMADVTVLGITYDVDFTLGYFLLGARPDPRLGQLDGGVLTLNVGAAGVNRNVGKKNSVAEADEAYTLQSLGASQSGPGEDIILRAFGATQLFHNVTSVRADFGDGADEFRVIVDTRQPVIPGVPITIDGGAGNDLLINETAAPVTFRGGAGNDVLVGSTGADRLEGEGDDDFLFGGGGPDVLLGGAGMDRITWNVGDGQPATLDGGADADTLTVTGTDAAETITVSPSGANVQAQFTGGTNASVVGAAFETLAVNARGGADTVTVNDLAGTTITTVALDLGNIEGTQSSSGSGTTVAARDDGAADTAVVRGTNGVDTFGIDVSGNLVRVTRAGSATVTLQGITPSLDRLRVEGLGGADAMTVAGPRSGSSAGEWIKIHLAGGAGADTYQLPIGGATFDGDGSDHAVFNVVDGDPTSVTVTSTQVSAGAAVTPYAGLADVAVVTDVSSPAAITVESTHAGATRLTLGHAGGTVTVKSTSGQVTAQANGAGTSVDRLVIDKTASAVPGVGSMTATQVSGIADVAYSGFETLDVNLGGGSDRFTINNTAAATRTTITTAAGTDEVVVRAVGGRTIVSGDAADTLTAEFTNPNSLTGSPFGTNLTFTVGKVVVRDVTAPPAASVAWSYRDGNVYVGTTKVFDTFGIPTTFQGASATGDSLTVEDTVDQPQIVNVDGARVRIQEGANVLAFNSTRGFDGFNYGVTVDGLAGATSVAVSPDGRFVYATGLTDDAVAVFRRNTGTGALSFVQVLKDGQLGVDGLNGADAVVVSPDGKNVYVASNVDNAIAIFERIAATGRLVYRGLYQDTGAVTSLAIAPNGANLYATNGSLIFRLARNSSTGGLTLGEKVFYGSSGYVALAISSDGNDLFAAGTSVDHVHFGTGGVLTSNTAGSYGFGFGTAWSDVAVGPNNTVYAGLNLLNVVVTFTYTANSLTPTATAYAPDSAHAALPTAVAVRPDGSQVASSFDTTSVPPSPPTRYLVLNYIHVINQSSDGDGDEPYINVNGNRIYTGANNSAPEGTFVYLSSYYDRPLTADVTIEVRDAYVVGEITPDNPVGAPVTVHTTDAVGNYHVDLRGYNIFDVEIIHYTLDFNIYEVTPPTPTVTPLVVFNRDGSGALSNLQQVGIGGVTRLDDLEYSPTTSDSRQDVYGASRLTNQITVNGGIGATDGQSQNLSAGALASTDSVQTAFSPDGKFAYSVSAKYGVLTIASVDASTGTLGTSLQAIPAGLTPGSSVVVSPDGKNVYVTNPAEDSVFVYDRNASTGLLTLGQVLTDDVNGVDGLAGARSIVVRPDGSQVYVAGYDENAVAVLSRNATTGRLTYASKFTNADLSGPSALVSSTEADLYVASANNGKVFWLYEQAGLSVLGVYSNGAGGVRDLSNPVALALSPDQKSLYVASKADNAVTVFARTPVAGTLAFVGSVRNGAGGVQGIDGVGAVAVSSDGKYVFAAGGVDTLAVFGRDAATGALTPLQRLRDGAAGFSGLEGVTDLDVFGGKVYVSSAGPDTGGGGVTVLDVAGSTPTPRDYDVSFAGVESLTVQSAGGGDLVNAGEVAVPFTLNTQGGADVVTLRTTAAGKATTVNLGDGEDTLDLLGTGDNSTTTVNGGNDVDTIRAYATGAGAVTTLNGGAGDDQILVDGARLGSQVTVNGDAPNFSTLKLLRLQVVNKNDVLNDDEPLIKLNGQTVFAAPDNSVSEGGIVDLSNLAPVTLSADVRIDVYDQDLGLTLIGALNVGVGDSLGQFTRDFVLGGIFGETARYRLTYQLTGDTPPNPGDTLTFDAHGKTTTPGVPQPSSGTVKATSAAFGVTYATIERINILGSPTANAGGPYTIAEGGSLSLSGTGTSIPSGHTVVSYEWTVGGRVVIGVSPATLTWSDLVAAGIADDGVYTVSLKVTTTLGGQTYSNTDVAALTVTNTAPTLTLTGPGTVEAGALFTLGLSSNDPGVDSVRTWTVNWGDGSPVETFNGTPATVTHVYNSAAGRTISVSATDEDGAYGPVTKALTVAAARTLSGPATVNEGSSYSLTLGRGAAGLPAIASWAINWGDGSAPQTVANDPTTVSHVYAADGTYLISAVAQDLLGVLHPAGNTLSVTAFDVAPRVILSQASPGPIEGDPSRPLILSVQVSDPGNETVASYVVSWGDGTTSVVKGTDLAPRHVYGDAAAYLVTVTSLTNSDGTFTNLSSPLSVVVADAGPRVVSLTGVPSPGAEGGALHVKSLVAGPVQGSDTLTFSWSVSGPNGYSQTLTGTVTPEGAVLPDDPAGLFPALPATLLGQARAYQGSFDFLTPENGSYLVTLTLTDDDGTIVSQSAEFAVANRPPHIESFVVPATGTETQPITLTASASDPAGPADPLSYRWKVTNVRTGTILTLDGPTVSFVPDGGTNNVELTVSDGDGGQDVRSASITVSSLPPQIVPGSLQVPTSANEADTVSFSVAGLDNDGSAAGLRYAWTVIGPRGDVTTIPCASVTFTFPDDGLYFVSVTVTDNENQSATSDRKSVTVANLNPTIASVDAPTSGIEGVGLHLAATVSDPAGAVDPVVAVWTLTAPNGTKSYVYGNEGSFTPADDGVYQVSLTVRDDDGGTATRELAPIVVANANPTLGAIVAPAGPVFEGDAVALSVSGDDVPGDRAALTYTWTITTPAGVTIHLTGPAVSFPTEDDGIYQVRVDLADGDGGTAFRTASVAVANLDPKLRTVAVPTTGYVGHAVVLGADATDAAGDQPDLVYTWTIAPPTGSAMILTGSMTSFTPTTAGSYKVTVVVTDGDGGQVTSAQSTVDVKATPITITRVNVPTTGQEGSPVALSAFATDALGGEPISFTWTITPAGRPAVTLIGREVTFTPADDGLYSVALRASNDNGEATAQGGTIAVANLNPVLTSLSWPSRAVVGSTVSFSAQAVDPAGANDPLTYSWTVTRPDGSSFTLSGPSVEFTADQLGPHGLKLVVTDGDGGQVTAQKILAVPNVPPVANAGGPYRISEGDALAVDATATTDANQSSATLKYEWDLNGDGVFTDASGATPSLNWAQLQALGIDDGPATFTVRVRVTDDYGDFDIASAELTVQNTAPTVTSLMSDHGTPEANPSLDGVVRIAGTVADPGRDTQIVRVNWGDGSAVQTFAVNPTTKAFSAAHMYAAGGIYKVTVEAVDSDSAVSQAVATKAVVAGAGVVDGTLYIFGTDGRDDIKVMAKNGDMLDVDAKLNMKDKPDDRRVRETFSRSGISRIVVIAYGGDDKVDLKTDSHPGASTAIAAIVLGGDGNDDLMCEDGNSVLVGGDGDDKLKSGDDRSVLIGGRGSDKLEGGKGEDVVIGGYTAYDNDLNALDRVLAKWTSPASYEIRVDALVATLLMPGVTVFDDGTSDDMKGQQGRDWFLGDLRNASRSKDKADIDGRASERFVQLP